jgi:tetratricopeptide (TPR) repeat protein
VLGIYVVIDNLLPFLIQASGNVAHGAHLGGFFAGLAVAALGESRWHMAFLQNSFSIGRFLGINPERRSPQALTFREKIENAIASADHKQLVSLADDAGMRDIQTLEAETTLEAARILKQRGFLEPATRMVKLTLATHRKSPLLPELYYQLGHIRLQQGFVTAAYQHLLTALDLHPQPDIEKKIRQLLQTIRI